MTKTKTYQRRKRQEASAAREEIRHKVNAETERQRQEIVNTETLAIDLDGEQIMFKYPPCHLDGSYLTLPGGKQLPFRSVLLAPKNEFGMTNLSADFIREFATYKEVYG